VCNIIGWDSDGTSEHEEWFESGRRIVYKESVIGVGGFPFLVSLLLLLYKQSKLRLWNSFDSCLVLIFSIRTSSVLCLFSISHFSYQYHLRPTPPITVKSRFWPTLILHCGQTALCTHPERVLSMGRSVAVIVYLLKLSLGPSQPLRASRPSQLSQYSKRLSEISSRGGIRVFIHCASDILSP